MNIIIDIPEELYEAYKGRPPILGDAGMDMIAQAIANGTLLPKPFDLEGLKKDMKALNCGYPYGLDYLLNCLKQRLGITIADINKEDK